MNLELRATWDALESDNIPIVDPQKLHALYKQLRKRIFKGEPLQQDAGNNGLVRHEAYSGRPLGNYGWQLFKTPAGTAMLEYRGTLSYSPHQAKPSPLDSEKNLRSITVTFHKPEPLFDRAKRVFDEGIERAKERLRKQSANLDKKSISCLYGSER